MGTVLIEILKALVFKLAWRTLVERAVTRGVIWGLKKLQSMSSNSFAKNTLEDVIRSMQGKGLKVMDDESVPKKLDENP